MKKKTRKQGFTLVEVLVVMAIVALLAATAIPKVKEIYAGAQLDKAEADAMQIAAAIQRVELKNALSNNTGVTVYTETTLIDFDSAEFKSLGLSLINTNFKFVYIKSETDSSRRIGIQDPNESTTTLPGILIKEVIIPE